MGYCFSLYVLLSIPELVRNSFFERKIEIKFKLSDLKEDLRDEFRRL